MPREFSIDRFVDEMRAGEVDRVAATLAAGVNEHQLRAAVYRAFDELPLQPLALLDVLASHGVPFAEERYHGLLRRLARWGRIDLVRLLVDRGAPPEALGWTPLLRAVALGPLEEVDRQLSFRPDLLEQDEHGRTVWALALQRGDVAVLERLAAAGGDICEAASMVYAVQGGQGPSVRWLLDRGEDPRIPNHDLVEWAVEVDAVEVLDVLLTSGAPFDPDEYGPLHGARSRAVVRRLLEAGADAGSIRNGAQRALVGLPSHDRWLDPTEVAAFRRGRARRFGSANPDRMQEPFWDLMIRTGASAYHARVAYDGGDHGGGPIWCADRFGQTITELGDGRIIQIGGEHEDGYDPDFCIYNDVFVHHPDGDIHVYGYPSDVFPPTDFHTATLVGDHIYVIGAIGYRGHRQFGHTPVHRLDVRDYRIEAVETTGAGPGWLSHHRAALVDRRSIRVRGGKVHVRVDGSEAIVESGGTFVLDLDTLAWTRVE